MRDSLYHPRCCSTLFSKAGTVKIWYYYIKILKLLLQMSNTPSHLRVVFLEECFSNFSMHQHKPEKLIRNQITGSHS